jgi:Flp pilus assembly protein TadD
MASSSHFRWTLPLVLCAWSSVGCQLAPDTKMEVVKAELANDPKEVCHQHRRGVDLLRRGRTDRAEAAFRKAIEADGEFAPAHNNLGLLQYDRRDLPAAACSFQRAIDLTPDRPEPYNNLGLTFEAAGKYDDAVRAYETAHRLAPADANCLGNLIRARLERGDAPAAVRPLLEQLVFVDTRSEWIDWARDQLALFHRMEQGGKGPFDAPLGVRGNSEVIPTPPPLSTGR